MSRPVEVYPSASIGQAVGSGQARFRLPKGYSSFRVINASTNYAYIKLGDVTVAATASLTGNMALGPGAIEILTLQSGSGDGDYLSVIGTDGSIGVTPCGSGV